MLFNLCRFFNLSMLFIINGLDYIIWEGRKIKSFEYILEKTNEEKEIEEEKKETIAYLDFLEELTKRTEDTEHGEQ